MPAHLPPCPEAPQPAAPRAWPGLCAVCRQWTRGALCSDCRGRFAGPRWRCGVCALSLGADAGTCGECRLDPPPFSRAVCVADYGFPWDALVARLKYGGDLALAPTLARLLADAVSRSGPELPAVDRVVPLPLAEPRLRERGYNQAWELARRVARQLGLAADATLLQRPVHSAAHQAELGRAERQRQLRGAFMVEPRRRAQLEGRRVALVDDVFTTGATAREAAAELRRAGAADVQVWVLARTPRPETASH